MSGWITRYLLTLTTAVLAFGMAHADDYWVKPMQKVHARFSGKSGTIAHFGDSITVTLAYWTPLQQEVKNWTTWNRMVVQAYQAPECWRTWRGPKYGSQSGQVVTWAHKNVDRWLKKLNPEVAVILFGTNDLQRVKFETYKTKLSEVVQKCLDNGTVVILTTIPPRSGREEKAAKYAQAIRHIAKAKKVPLIDFHKEILTRRPKDWNGQLKQFAKYKGYDVPTLISRDGVHPSAPKATRNDYSKKALKENGYGLRNYLTLDKYAEVIWKVLSRRVVKPLHKTRVLKIALRRTALLRLPEAPLRVQLGNAEVAVYTLLTPREILVHGKKRGETELTFWFGSPDNIEDQDFVTITLRVVSAQ